MSSSMPLGARVIALTALLWNLFGLAVYLLWSSRNSRLAKGEEPSA